MKYLPHTDLLRRKNPSSRIRHHRRFLSAKSYRKLLHYIRAKNQKKFIMNVKQIKRKQQLQKIMIKKIKMKKYIKTNKNNDNDDDEK